MFGGAGFASALISAGLVDEFQFYVNPTVLGDGVRIFETTGFQKLKLLGCKAIRAAWLSADMHQRREQKQACGSKYFFLEGLQEVARPHHVRAKARR